MKLKKKGKSKKIRFNRPEFDAEAHIRAGFDDLKHGRVIEVKKKDIRKFLGL